MKTVTQSATKMISGAINSFKGINIPNINLGANGGIKYHATGAIATAPTWLDSANIIGEAGAEAILPLDRNTEWMDKIADKVAARMGSLRVDFTVNTPVTLDGTMIAQSQTKQTRILNLQNGAAE